MNNNNEDIKNLIADLNERKKELNCLYEINRILKYPSARYDDIFNDIIKVIPPGWRFPDICKVQILFDGRTYKSEDLQITELRQTALLKIEESVIGEIQIYYVKSVKTEKNPIFLFEEQKLLNNIAEDISQYFTLKRFRDLLKNEDVIAEKHNISIGLSKFLSELHLSEQDLKLMLSTKVSFKKGESIFKQGTFASYIVIQTKGLTKAHIEDINERSFTVKIIKPYDIIGLSSLFGNGLYGFSASAITIAEGYLIEKKTMIRIIERNMKFNFELLKWHSVNFQLIYSKINSLANKQALGSIANTLIYLSNDIFDGKIIENTITRKNIAELSGMSTENAVRILSELKNDGIIKIAKSGIEIIKQDRLKTFSIAG